MSSVFLIGELDATLVTLKAENWFQRRDLIGWRPDMYIIARQMVAG